MKRRFTWPRLIFGSIAVLLLAAWYVPKISAAGYREPIRAALENALGRKVQIGEVEFRLLPVPGFTIVNVRIGEDPAIGAEPIAYVTTLRARPRLSALFGGPLAFASVDLENTSVNLTRVDRDTTGVRWNFTSLMRPKLLATFPSIHMIDGRVNFKFGDTKSVFYLLHTDVDIWPPAQDNDPWTLKVHAEPARTDRPARGFGSFIARGQWEQRTSTVTLDVKLERSEFGDMMTLVQGHESGMHGHIWGDAHLGGPLTHVGVAGHVTVDDIHGWNQTPPPGNQSWPFAIGGFINQPGQTIELRATTGGNDPPLDIHYRVANYLAHPEWTANAILKRLPIAPLIDIGRGSGWNIPVDWRIEGTADGAVAYVLSDKIPALNGDLTIATPALFVPNSQPVRMADAHVQFSGSTITLAPATLTGSSDETASIAGSFDTGSRTLEASLSTDGMAITSLNRQIPILGLATSGTWSGALTYSGSWTGTVHIHNADVPFEAFAEPLHLASADVTIDGANVAMKNLNVSMAGIVAQGEYVYDPEQPRHHRFRLTAAKVNAGRLEKLLMPALHRGTFLNYAFNFGRVPEPDWMRAMSADGIIQIADLDIAGKPFTKVRARLLWDGDQVRLATLQAQRDGAAFSGEALIDLSQRQPQYQINGKLTGLPWRSGALDAEGTLRTTGTGDELLAAMNAQGSFKERGALDKWDSANGCFDWNKNGIRLTQLVMNSAGNTYLGDGQTQPNGKLAVHVSDGTKTIQEIVDLTGR